MQMRFIVATAIACAASLNGQGTAHIDSIIVTDRSGQPVPFVHISVKGGTARLTNEHGELILRASDDTLNLVARRIDYDAYQARLAGARRTYGRSRACMEGRGGCTMTVLVDGIVMHNMLGDKKDANNNAAKSV